MNNLIVTPHAHADASNVVMRNTYYDSTRVHVAWCLGCGDELGTWED